MVQGRIHAQTFVGESNVAFIHMKFHTERLGQRNKHVCQARNPDLMQREVLDADHISTISDEKADHVGKLARKLLWFTPPPVSDISRVVCNNTEPISQNRHPRR